MADAINVPGVPVTPISPNVTPDPRGYLATEPVKAATRALQVVTVVTALAAFFGLDLSDAQRESLPIIAPGLLVGLEFIGGWLRANVTPVQRAQNRIDVAFVSDPSTNTKPTLPT